MFKTAPWQALHTKALLMAHDTVSEAQGAEERLYYQQMLLSWSPRDATQHSIYFT